MDLQVQGPNCQLRKCRSGFLVQKRSDAEHSLPLLTASYSSENSVRDRVKGFGTLFRMRSPELSDSNHKQVDAASYNLAAVEFDRLTERFNGPLAMRMLEFAQLQAKDYVLDVGTGTGLVALRAGSLAKNGRIIGIDHSLGMLEQASAKAQRSRLADVVTFQQMDAELLEFPDQCFDAVLSLYALFHFPEPLVAIREMHRVLRTGGKVVIGVGSGPNLCSWSALEQGLTRVSHLVAAARGRLLTAPHFLLRLMSEHGMSPDEQHEPKPPRTPISQMLQQVGFRRVHERWQGYREVLDPEDFWAIQVTYASQARIRLQHATRQEVATLKDDFLERCRVVQANHGKLIYPHAATFYVGTRA
jgi:ubiquinone/menaquinone biosynthesis C-methylase UbiE